MTSSSEVDLIVVGAGAAGLAAARTARAGGLAVRVLEAGARPGGRAVTDTETLGVLWDRGAHWLHNALANPLRRCADELGMAYDQGPRDLRLFRPGHGFASTEFQDAFFAFEEAALAAVVAAGRQGLDVPCADVLPVHPNFRTMLDSWFAAFNGVEPERMSTLDYARSVEGANWGVVDGYGTLLLRAAGDQAVDLQTPVRRIGWSGPRVRVETARGTLEAAAAIVTVSTGVLATSGLMFDPPLPERHQTAIAAVPLGQANKVAVAFKRNVLGTDAHHFLAFEHPTLETIRFDMRPAGRDLALGYFGGRFAGEIEAAGDAAMAAFALDQLAAAYGGDIRNQVKGIATTGWCGDPRFRGGYSCARPGQAAARQVLSESLAGRVFFAGEACSIEAYGTVHGAWASGEAVAGGVLRDLWPERNTSGRPA